MRKSEHDKIKTDNKIVLNIVMVGRVAVHICMLKRRICKMYFRIMNNTKIYDTQNCVAANPDKIPNTPLQIISFTPSLVKKLDRHLFVLF